MLCPRRLRLALSALTRHYSASSSASVESLVFSSASDPAADGGGGGGGGGRDTLGRRLLSLIFPKRSAVVVLHKWAEEGKTVQKYELNRVVRALRSYRRYKHALEVFQPLIMVHELLEPTTAHISKGQRSYRGDQIGATRRDWSEIGLIGGESDGDGSASSTVVILESFGTQIER